VNGSKELLIEMGLDRKLIVPPTDEVIRMAAAEIRHGRLVVMPTETVYGLAADAFNPIAVSKIFETKNRPFFDPLICHITDLEMLNETAVDIPEPIEKLIEKFWPGPLTVVVTKSSKVPEIVSAGLSTVGIRMPSHPIAKKLIQNVGRPVAAPSANIFGKISPTQPEHTLELDGDVAAIIDGGKCEVGIESTIVRYHNNSLHLLRPGGITLEQIEECCSLNVIIEESAKLPEAPGQLESHYAPNSNLILIDEGEKITHETTNCCFIGYKRVREQSNFIYQEALSPTGSLTLAASRLFELLHKMDSLNPEIIYVERLPEVRLGHAIMNRLRKSSAKN
jgi:L-threonylcarbamoyladenylate synthase